MEATLRKDARIELKTTFETKDIIVQAATALGMDASAFLLLDAVDRARKVLLDQKVIRLSCEEQKLFAELMRNPPKPTEAIKKLWDSPDLPERA